LLNEVTNNYPSTAFTLDPILEEKLNELHNDLLFSALPQHKISKDHLILVFGGDGSILRAARDFPENKILGINCGSFGFLCEINNDDILTYLPLLIKHEYQIKPVSKLSFSINNNEYIFLNEVVISGTETGRPIRVIIKINDFEFPPYVGDGVIVSTPIGSTAYSLAAGGAVITPYLPIIQVTPICSFFPQVKPLIVSDSRTISLTNASKDNQAFVFCDGEKICEIGSDQSIVVLKSDEKCHFISFSSNFFNKLSAKIFLGKNRLI
jgi:NAD+ kinase